MPQTTKLRFERRGAMVSVEFLTGKGCLRWHRVVLKSWSSLGGIAKTIEEAGFRARVGKDGKIVLECDCQKRQLRLFPERRTKESR